MMRRSILFVVVVSVFLSNPVHARDSLQKIEEAQTLLTHTPLGMSAGKEHILLCVLDREHLRIIEVHRGEGMLKGFSEKQEILHTITNDCFVEKIGGDGIATNYAVVCDERHLPLLAVKQRDRFGKEVVYTPYSDFLLKKEIIDAGREYIKQAVVEARSALLAHRVPSLAYPGRLAGEVNGQQQELIVEALAINEHADEYVVRQIGIQTVIVKVYAVLGANKKRAYSHSKSARAAWGIGQIIQGTYLRVAKEYPSAHLMPDFQQGATNHLNAIKAMFCVIDIELKELPALKDVFERDPRNASLFIAMFYNAGSHRVRKFLTAYGEGWKSSFAIPPQKARHLIPQETWWFLRKHRQITRFLT